MHVPSQDFLDELAARVNTLQNQNAMLLSQMAGAAKLLNAAVVENQILKAELHALDTNGTPKPAVSPAWGHAGPFKRPFLLGGPPLPGGPPLYNAAACCRSMPHGDARRCAAP